MGAGVRVNMWAHQPSRLTERNLGQNLCNLGQYVRLNVGSHLHMHMCPSLPLPTPPYPSLPLPTPPHEVNLAKIKLPTQRVKLYNHACVCSCVGVIMELIRNIAIEHGGLSLFAGFKYYISYRFTIIPSKEYFLHQDVLIFIDNVFRFLAVGYQPTLCTEMGSIQERIVQSKKD